jgi:polyphosphate kinase
MMGTQQVTSPADGHRVPARIANRELSWLDFNARVLELAADDSVPLLERVKFLAIFSSNLDEFFQVRVAALKDQVAANVNRPGPDGLTAGDQLRAINARVAALVARQEALLDSVLMPILAVAGIHLTSWTELDDAARHELDAVFEQRIFPVLTPLAVDPGHPFPYISNLSLNLAVIVRDPVLGDERFARVKVPNSLPRFVALHDQQVFVPLEQVIAAHLGSLFPGMEIIEHVSFRVTRNTDLTWEEEEAEDLLAAVEFELRRRRFGRAVRLEVPAEMSPIILETLVRELDLHPQDVSLHRSLLDLNGLWAMYALDRDDLKDVAWPAVTTRRLHDAAADSVSIFDVVRERDLLVHHPYESFRTSTEDFVLQAADDPRVLTIKMTLYRTSGDSPIVKHLIRAAERGVQVAVLVELKARFDEERNITWARALERAGVHVVYGLVGLKTHTKTVLVVRDDVDGIRRYCHMGTGNYNPSTARLYEDFGLLTCDPAIGSDLSQLFNFLTGYSREARYATLLVAPRWLRHRLGELIDNEAAHGSAGHIIMKVNSMSDPEVIEALYRASQAGVSIELFVRGICCLLPGVAGMSENIRVRSLVGRFLEHSRIFYFGNATAPGDPLWLTGSADMMGRNLDGRVEALVPIASPELQGQLRDVVDALDADDTSVWELGPDGSWSRIPTVRGVSAQRLSYEAALARARTA